jgi:hypothetical protein
LPLFRAFLSTFSILFFRRSQLCQNLEVNQVYKYVTRIAIEMHSVYRK